MSIYPFEYCYNWMTSSTPSFVLRLEVWFVGSAWLVLPAKGYMIDAAPRMKGIGLRVARGCP